MVSQVSEVLELVENTEKVYWCLLLEPVGEAKYKRVGVAMLYPHALDVLGVENTNFAII